MNNPYQAHCDNLQCPLSILPCLFHLLRCPLLLFKDRVEFTYNFTSTYRKYVHNARVSKRISSKKAFGFRGASPLPHDPKTRGSAPGPRCGLCPQTPVTGSHFALAMCLGLSRALKTLFVSPQTSWYERWTPCSVKEDKV